MAKIDSNNLLAPAKINVRLEIIGKREDGFHEIRSIMCAVGLYDTLSLSKTPAGITLTSSSSEIPLDNKNLAFKAASVLMQTVNVSAGVRIHLEKHIPIAAGLGGGSSDAAATMRGVDSLYGLNYASGELRELGAKIGADVPFFFSNGPALATGIGEKLSPIELSPPFWVLLVTPAMAVSTAWVYSQFTSRTQDNVFTFSKKIDLLKMGKEILYNDLERVVIFHFPEIAKIKKTLENHGAWGALMSGSGPTVFGIFFEEEEARRAETKLVKSYHAQNWKISVAKALL
jgi:4-diphosphocytidyl-2-C-methyl-D-erythritol kinase